MKQIDIEAGRAVDGVQMTDLVGATEARTGKRTFKCPWCAAERGLMVSNKYSTYHCFSCGIGGNAVKWVRDRHGVNDLPNVINVLNGVIPGYSK